MARAWRIAGSVRSVGLAAVLLLSACDDGALTAETGEENRMEQVEIPLECDFSSATDMYSDNECSPRIVESGFRGLAINAPRQVLFTAGESTAFGGFAEVPICGTYKYDLSLDLDTDASFEDSILVVAVDRESHQSWSGLVRESVDLMPAPEDTFDDELTDEDLQGVSMEGHFNPNLTEILTLPARPAAYDVYATVGPYRSNTVTIEIRERD